MARPPLGSHMSKPSFKRRFYLTIAAVSFLFRNWTIRKKLYIGFASLILVLAFNVVLTSYEISRLDVSQSKLMYLVYLDVLGIITGCLFIWIISQSVLRPMKRIIQQLESKNSLDSLQHYYNDEIGQLARAVSYVKKNKSTALKSEQDEKRMLLEAILHASMERIFIFDHLGRLTSASRGFKVVTGLNSQEKTSHEISDIFVNLNLKNAFEHLAQTHDDAPFYVQHVMCRKKDGKMQRIECSICKVEGVGQDMYIGIVKELNRTVRMKETLKRTLAPFRKK